MTQLFFSSADVESPQTLLIARLLLLFNMTLVAVIRCYLNDNSLLPTQTDGFRPTRYLEASTSLRLAEPLVTAEALGAADYWADCLEVFLVSYFHGRKKYHQRPFNGHQLTELHMVNLSRNCLDVARCNLFRLRGRIRDSLSPT